MIKTIYLEPGDMIEVRLCDPVFDYPRNKQTWEMSINPRTLLIQVDSANSIAVPFDVSTFVIIGNQRKQRL